MAQEDLFRQRRRLRQRLTERLLALEWTSRAEPGQQQLTQEEEEMLRALGYLD